MNHSVFGKKILLIGGAGFIGHNLALHLKALGGEIEVIDGLQVNNLLTYSSSYPDLHNKDLYLKIINERLDLLRNADIPLHPMDARDYHALGDLIHKGIRPNIIVHLAAVSHAGRSNKDPHSTFDHSLRTLENALDCSRGSGHLDQVEQFIYLSSSMAYGNFLSEEVTEDHPLDPIGIYGALKVAGEKMVIAYQQVFDIPYTILRPSALYGPRCVSRRVGQIFIENALNKSKLRVDGDGSDKLDFTYIEDLVSGIAATIGNPAAENEIFNITYGQSRSISELVEVIQYHFEDVEIERVERDALMPFRGTLSIDKIRDSVGYNPSFPLESGMEKYIEWYRNVVV